MDKYITVGVAGHVDHGKTSLVRSLTGIETDRLKEEKRRGLSIEAGIAPLNLSEDIHIAFIDVPGHTDFLKNTIRGLNSVDIALLVVAADDGVMPQTTEHMEILKFLGVKEGFIVLTKADLVDQETLAIAEMEIREVIRDTFLECEPVVPFSALDGRGIPDIRKILEHKAKEVAVKDRNAPFRLWVDQVRGLTGFGTVTSGTILSGTIKKGDTIHILPEGKETSARFLEVHHQRVSMGVAGQRIGINLSKINMEDVSRGMLLAKPRTVNVSYLLNVELSILPKAKKSLKNRQRVKLYVGTMVTNALCIIMEKDHLKPGERGYVQFRLLNQISAIPGDPFVICLLNQPVVIGGGTILEIPERKYRAVKANQTIQYLKAMQKGDLGSVIDHFQSRVNSPLLKPEEIARHTGFSIDRVNEELRTRLKKGDFFDFQGRGLISKAYYQKLKEDIVSIHKAILSDNPLTPAVSADKIKKQLPPSFDDALLQRLLEDLCQEGRIVKVNTGFSIPNHSVALSANQKKLVALLSDYAQTSGLVPFTEYAFWSFHQKRFSKKEIHKALDYLCFQKKLVRLKNDRFLSANALEHIKEQVKEVINKKGAFTITDSKELLGYGRNIGIPVLEYLDSIGLTCRKGNERVLADIMGR